MVLTPEEKRQALDWYVNKGFDLATIAQHYGLTVEQLKRQLNNQQR